MKIPQNIIEELIAQAEKDAPDESCGYLLGTGDEVTENYWMENIDHSSEHFSFAPKDQFAALKYARSAFLFCAEGPVCSPEICAQQELKNPRQLA